MPTYRIVVQTKVSPEAETRHVRSTEFSGVEFVDVTASTLAEAALEVARRHAGAEQPPRIVSAEELLTIDLKNITDNALARTVGNQLSVEDLESYDGVVLYARPDFDSIIADVAAALRDSGAVPGLHLSLQRDADGVCDYIMVEIHDTATGTYRAVGRESRDLIADRSLTGHEGIISIARRLIETAATAHLL